MIGGRLADTRGRRLRGGLRGHHRHAAHRGDGPARRVADVGALGRRRDLRRHGRPGAGRLRAGAVPHLAARPRQRRHLDPGGDRQRHRARRRRPPVRPLGRPGSRAAVLAIGPLLMAALVLLRYPETVHRELEELNPEDRLVPPVPSGRIGAGPAGRFDAVLVPPAGSARRALARRPCGAPGHRRLLGRATELAEPEPRPPPPRAPPPPPVHRARRGAEVAQAEAPSIDVYASEDADRPRTADRGGRGHHADTIPIVFLVRCDRGHRATTSTCRCAPTAATGGSTPPT